MRKFDTLTQDQRTALRQLRELTQQIALEMRALRRDLEISIDEFDKRGILENKFSITSSIEWADEKRQMIKSFAESYDTPRELIEQAMKP